MCVFCLSKRWGYKQKRKEKKKKRNDNGRKLHSMFSFSYFTFSVKPARQRLYPTIGLLVKQVSQAKSGGISCLKSLNKVKYKQSACSLMDRASDCGSDDCEFKSRRAHITYLFGGVLERFIWPVSKTVRVVRLTEVQILSPPPSSR